MNIHEEVQKIALQVIACRRDLHKYPEVGWTEFRTTSVILKKMQELGYEITMGDNAMVRDARMGVPAADVLKKHQERAIAQGADPEIVAKMDGGMTGLWADMKFSDDGPFVAFRFDIDALPIIESDEAEHFPYANGFASVNHGVMHACGHDGHTSIGLGTAAIIAGMRDKLKGRIRFIFQPAEEGVRGAKPMMDAGAVDGVDYFAGNHMGVHQKGYFACGVTSFLASTKMNVYFTGKGAHASLDPHLGKNALMACCCATMNIQAISRHGDGPTRVNVGKIISGEGRNMIAPHAYMEMETRGLTSELDEYMLENVHRILKAAADMYQCEYHTEVVGSAKTAESDDKMLDIVESAAREMDYYKEIVRVKDNKGATDDVTYLMRRVQQNGGVATYMHSGADLAEAPHTGKYSFDEEELPVAVELFSRIAYKILGK